MSNHETHYACERLIYRFLDLLESDQSATADLFSEDADAFGLIGREAIREHFEGIERVDNNVNVNLCTNLLVDSQDDDHATASHYVTHYVSDPIGSLTNPMGGEVQGESSVPRSITRWHWAFERVDGVWLISKMAYPDSVLLRRDVLDNLRTS
ncbi:MAG: nuclear transport factor 2 family protein [Pseudomonadota bacterium]